MIAILAQLLRPFFEQVANLIWQRLTGPRATVGGDVGTGVPASRVDPDDIVRRWERTHG